MPPRGFGQGDLVMATLRHFRPRIVSEEGSFVWVLGLLGLPSQALGLLGLPALPRGLLLGHASPVGCEAHEAALDAPDHADLDLSSIFCLLSLTPDATIAMLFSSRFIVSIWTR